MSDADWDTKVVIGNKGRAPKVTKGNTEINGMYMSFFFLACDSVFINFITAARRAGAVVSTDKKTTGGNKGHVGTPRSLVGL
jgi:putative transcription factor